VLRQERKVRNRARDRVHRQRRQIGNNGDEWTAPPMDGRVGTAGVYIVSSSSEKGSALVELDEVPD